MREFIGNALIFLGLFALPLALIALILPNLTVKPGAPPMSRLSLVFSMLVPFVVLTVAGVSILPSQTNRVDATAASEAKPPTDAELLRSTRAQFAATRNLFDAQQIKVFSFALSGMKQKNISIDEKVKVAGDLFTEMLATLDRANDMEIPNIVNASARRYVTEAIDNHKKWAVMQQARIRASIEGNADFAKEFNNQADKLAIEEALALGMAYRAAGLQSE